MYRVSIIRFFLFNPNHSLFIEHSLPSAFSFQPELFIIPTSCRVVCFCGCDLLDMPQAETEIAINKEQA
jgi:hypothetical protein